MKKMEIFSHNKKSQRIFPPARTIACLLCFCLFVSGLCLGLPTVYADNIVPVGGLKEGELSSVSLDPKGRQTAYFLFEPQETAEYEFDIFSDASMYTAITFSSGTEIKTASGDSNLSLQYKMTGGVKYYIYVRFFYFTNQSGTISLRARRPLDVTDFDKKTPLTGITDGERLTIDAGNPTVLVSFQPQESDYYSIFSQDVCGGDVPCSQSECPQDCSCRQGGNCTCLNDLRVAGYTKSGNGSLTPYCYGESDENGSLFIYQSFTAGTTYYFEVSSKSGLTEGSFLFCIGKGLSDNLLPAAAAGTDIEGCLRDDMDNLIYTFQPDKTATYQFQSKGRSTWLYMTLYGPQMNELISTKSFSHQNKFDVKTPQKLEQGKTYYLKINTKYSGEVPFSFRIDMIEDPDDPGDGSGSSGDGSGGNSSSGDGSGSSGDGSGGNSSSGDGSGSSGDGSGGNNSSGNSGGSSIIILPGDGDNNGGSGNGNSNGGSGNGNGNGGSGNGGGTIINKKKSITSVTLKAIGTKAYTGKAIKPSVTLKDGNTTLKNGTDYTVSYSNNKKIGTAKVTIKGIGNYEGTRTASFKIVPNKTKIAKAKRKGKKLTLQWKKVKGATGYEIKYSTSSKFKKAKTKTTKKCKFTLKLPNKKKWYVRIRAYKKVGKKKVYGSYSKAKKS